jgi:DedD protein
MESQGLRDVERWKDKIEVRLDNRQVAFLFFGSALCACMLFILGVIVGKRLESRGRAMAPEIEDPLALLDRVAASTTPAPAVVEPVTAPTRPRRSAAAKPVDKPVARPAVDRPADKPLEKVTDKTADKASDKVADKAADKVADKAAVVTPPPPVKPRSPTPPASEALTAAPVAAEVPPTAASTSPSSGKPRFMLQVGSFPMRAEADAFAATFAGQNSMVVPWDVPGKGLWYRVRVGNYQTFKEAIDAKIVFEKKHNKIALVIGPL